MLKEVTDKLAELYDITGMDWVLTIHQTLTEPTCPIVIINPEGLDATRYRIDADDIEQGIIEAVERVYQEVILGEILEPLAPFTNPDDKTLRDYIDAWHRGEKPVLDRY